MPQNPSNYKIKRKEIGERFRIFRQLLKKSQEEIANETYIPLPDLKKTEEGIYIPDIMTIGYLCDRYGLNLTWLIYGKENVFYKETPHTPRYIFDHCHQIPNDIETLNAFLSIYNDDHESENDHPGELP